VVASSPEHLCVMGKRGRERGKAEECGAVSATVTLTMAELQWHLGRAEAAMRLTSGSTGAARWLTRSARSRRSSGQDGRGCGATARARRPAGAVVLGSPPWRGQREQEGKGIGKTDEGG
jgi:hypothetical protein